MKSNLHTEDLHTEFRLRLIDVDKKLKQAYNIIPEVTGPMEDKIEEINEFEDDHPWLTVESDLDEEVVFALDELRFA